MSRSLYRWAEGRTERAPEIFAEFVRLKVEVIVTHPTALAVAAKQATSLIPIVFALAGDPVGSGLVTSLARPGGNVTGLSLQMPDALTKRLELLREIVPGLRRLTILVNVGNLIAVQEMRSVEELAATLGIETIISEIRRAEDIEAAFEAFNGRSEALYVCTEPLVNIHRARINALALNGHLPSVVGFPEFVEAGGLISFGPNYPALWRRSAEFVDKILRGAKPADIPVEQPTKFDLVLNLKTAKTLGLAIPAIATAARRRGDRVSNCHLVAGRSLIDLVASRLALRAPALRAATALTWPNRSAQRLPCGRRAAPTAVTVDPSRTVAEHGVERGDHLTHHRHDDDLRLLSGGLEAIVECFEPRIPITSAQRRHVEHVADARTTAPDATAPFELAAIEIIGCKPDESGKLKRHVHLGRCARVRHVLHGGAERSSLKCLAQRHSTNRPSRRGEPQRSAQRQAAR